MKYDARAPSYLAANLAQPEVLPTDRFLFRFFVLLSNENATFTILINRSEEVHCLVFNANGEGYLRSILAADARIPVDLLDAIPARIIEDLYLNFVAHVSST
ncbi:hypothetical protein L195_g022523 [Trifolium pratense]|uniref:Uncharacterized protein n=1 Tax=Trifolium pratense TaxID=57577 RepID=A0A2K3N8D7_TRIPR|nr:hypothetical protein L195_g022523 [Trifolium pratense]